MTSLAVVEDLEVLEGVDRPADHATGEGVQHHATVDLPRRTRSSHAALCARAEKVLRARERRTLAGRVDYGFPLGPITTREEQREEEMGRKNVASSGMVCTKTHSTRMLVIILSMVVTGCIDSRMGTPDVGENGHTGPHGTAEEPPWRHLFSRVANDVDIGLKVHGNPPCYEVGLVEQTRGDIHRNQEVVLLQDDLDDDLILLSWTGRSVTGWTSDLTTPRVEWRAEGSVLDAMEPVEGWFVLAVGLESPTEHPAEAGTEGTELVALGEDERPVAQLRVEPVPPHIGPVTC